MNFETFLIGFLLGCVVGGLFMVYAIAPRKEAEAVPASTANLADILNTQMAYQQTQNMMKELQLQAARQEAEFNHLEQQRLKFVTETNRMNQYDLRKALESLQEGRSC